METNSTEPRFIPTEQEQKDRLKTYGQLQQMIQLKDEKKPHFAGPDGWRSYNEYIDASERILNGYTPSKEEQGKDDWQSNVQDNITRAKMRAVAASVGLQIPGMKYMATNKNGVRSKRRAEVLHQTVRHSYMRDNPTMSTFLEVWAMLAHGVTFTFEGYQSGGYKRDVVESFDSKTGEIKTKSEYVSVDQRPIDIRISPKKLYWATFNVNDIQKQPCLIWIEKYSKSELEIEFSKYKNFKYIKDKSALKDSDQTTLDTYGYKSWNKRVEYEEFEVLKKFSKEENRYEIWVNGIPLLIAPMLWSFRGMPWYPIAKTIGEPFANSDFFVGLSFAAMLEGYQENRTTVLNTMTDILYRSLVTPLLVGLGNKDLLEAQDELISSDDRYYVPDVNQVKPMPTRGIMQGDLAMLQVIDQSIERLSIDAAQQGQTTPDVTARATIIADERARQLKGVLFLFLEDHWLQKTRLRNITILTHYFKDKARQKTFKDSTISVDDVKFSDGTVGILDIHVAKNRSKLLTVAEIESREQAAEKEGINYKLISVTADYLDNWEYDHIIIPESLHNQDRLRKQASIEEEHNFMVTFYPDYFAENKDIYLEDVLEFFDRSKDEMKPPQAPQPQIPGGQDQGPDLAAMLGGSASTEQPLAALPGGQ